MVRQTEPPNSLLFVPGKWMVNHFWPEYKPFLWYSHSKKNLGNTKLGCHDSNLPIRFCAFGEISQSDWSKHNFIFFSWEKLVPISVPKRRSPCLKEGEWKQRWLAISRCHISGATRPFLWLLLHRRTPLMYKPWLRHHYHSVTGRCMVCAEDRVETFQHLFIECEAATFLWEGLTPLLEAVRFNFADTHQGRLLGDVSGFDTSPLITAAWPEEPSNQRYHPQVDTVNVDWNSWGDIESHLGRSLCTSS